MVLTHEHHLTEGLWEVLGKTLRIGSTVLSPTQAPQTNLCVEMKVVAWHKVGKTMARQTIFIPRVLIHRKSVMNTIDALWHARSLSQGTFVTMEFTVVSGFVLLDFQRQ